MEDRAQENKAPRKKELGRFTAIIMGSVVFAIVDILVKAMADWVRIGIAHIKRSI